MSGPFITQGSIVHWDLAHPLAYSFVISRAGLLATTPGRLALAGPTPPLLAWVVHHKRPSDQETSPDLLQLLPESREESAGQRP